MDYSYFLNSYQLDFSQLVNYGFKEINNHFIYQSNLKSDAHLYLKIDLIPPNLFVNVYDSVLEEPYQPFTIHSATGELVSLIRSEVDVILKEIFRSCDTQLDPITIIKDYVISKYHTNLEYPWPETPDFCTLKNLNNHKWYGLIMLIPAKSLGLNGDNILPVINLKNDPTKIAKIINHHDYFPAYHMNKKYWLTVILNYNNLDNIKNLITESYNLVAKIK